MWGRRGGVTVIWRGLTSYSLFVRRAPRLSTAGVFHGTQIAELDSWLVSEWLNGLDSLQDAFADPKVRG